VDLAGTAAAVEDALERLHAARAGRRLPRVAVMGCVVNGPGEAKDADIALCGGDGEFLLYVNGRPAGKFPEAEAVGKVIEHVVSYQ
jgi:(E)-4-hydroxy-3-methylbut-2-enyl-diphosphate synthase